MTESVYTEFERRMIGRTVEIGIYPNDDEYAPPAAQGWGRLVQVQKIGNDVGIWFSGTRESDLHWSNATYHPLITVDLEED